MPGAAAFERVRELSLGTGSRAFRDCARDDLGLGEKALAARVDQSLAELVEIKHAAHQHAQRHDIENDDAARQARKTPAQEKGTENIESAHKKTIGGLKRASPRGGPAGLAGLRGHVRRLVLGHARHDPLMWRFSMRRGIPV